MKILIIFLFFGIKCLSAQVSLEKHDFSFEYGFMFHTLEGQEKFNNTRGRLSTKQMPFYSASYGLRFSQNYALKLLGGIQILRYDEPKGYILKKEDQVLNEFGLELIKRMSPYVRMGFFLKQQDQNVYYTKNPGEFEIDKLSFFQSGLNISIGHRRRVGLLWGIGLEAFSIFPTKGGNVATEFGYGGKAYARLGFATPMGTLYQLRAANMITTAPTAVVSFTHSILSYSLLVGQSF